MASKKQKKSPSMAKYSWLAAGVLIILWMLYLVLFEQPWREKAPSIAENPDFRVIYIDVGQADAALVLCEGESMLIDGGNVADSDVIYTVLQKQGVEHLDYVICSHAHEDHVGGLSAALTACTADRVYAPVTYYDTKAFGNFVRKTEEQGLNVTVPEAGDSFSLGSAQVEILACDPDAEETNNTSIVLKIVYGQTSFLFTGDAEAEVERALLDAGADVSATVLKVGHHGSETATSYRFLNEVMPQYAVISVGRDNSYGHPHEAVLSRLRDADVTVLRTDELGDIECSSDGRSVTFLP